MSNTTYTPGPGNAPFGNLETNPQASQYGIESEYSPDEEILIARSAVDQAEQTRANAEVSLAVIQAQADINISNLYDDIPSLLQDVYADADVHFEL